MTLEMDWYIAAELPSPKRRKKVAPRTQRKSTIHPRLDLVISYAKKLAALAGTLRAMAGPKPLYRPLTPSEASIFLKASMELEYFGFL